MGRLSSWERPSSLRVGLCRTKTWKAGKPDYVWRQVRSYIRDEFSDWRRVVLSSPHNVRHYLSLTRSLHPVRVGGLFLKLREVTPLGVQRIASLAQEVMLAAGIFIL